MAPSVKEDPASTTTADLREAQQQRILAAAMTCFARSGFHKASMQDICAEAGMSAGNLYRYFRSKEAIIAAIAEADRVRNAEIFEVLERTDDPVRGLCALARAFLREMHGREAPALCTEIIAEALRNPEIRAMFERNINEAHAACAKALRRGIEQGTVDPGIDVDVTVRLLMAMGDGIIAHRPMADFMTDDRIDAVLDTLLERFLRPGAPPTPPPISE
ncbi:TetR/AcrR family transcriptional regulator [Skermanella sp. TT6]|uniref:TetR/AcrR family transcriptional regulator n=1 Tax=Skermanella cutis TaxID=2775420 RepID=A0ABX7BAL0_9PROT|nr:TetR/AcrR family transcriptional regulator [Skermanella sp. TT6]QQP91431.1 TetR/AcrR family transcriptional regulator [Skermanella sp. TT6]